MLKKPDFLTPGDVVVIVAPGSTADIEWSATGATFEIEVLGGRVR